MDDVFPVEFPPLADHHRKYLNDAAIADSVIDRLQISSNDNLDHIVFPWTDGKSTVYVKRPDKPRSLRQRYIWPDNNPLITWHVRNTDSNIVLLVEGVKQTLAVDSWAPVQFNVIGMNGCWGWKKTDISWAEGKDVIVILDGDRLVNEDVAKAAEALSHTLERQGAKSTAFVKLPAHGTNGIDDELAQLLPADRTRYLQSLVDSAQLSGRRLVLKSALEYKPKRRKWLYEGYIPMGNLCILAGYEGTAKSTVTTDIVAQLTRGDLPGDSFGTPRPVIYVTAEEDWEYDILPRLIASGSNLGNVYNVFLQHDTGAELSLSIKQDLAEIKRTIVMHDVALLVFDSLLYFLGDNVDIDNAKPVNDVLLPLVKVGLETECTMLGILHFNKSSSMSNPLDKIANSKAFTRIARSVIMTAKHEDHFIFSAEKLSGAPVPPPVKFRLEEVTLPPEYTQSKEVVKSVRVEWLGNSEVNVADLLRMHTRGEDGSTKHVDEWLREYLDMNGGEAPAREINEAGAKELGWSRETLRRAKVRLKIEHRRDGYGPGSKMYWRYPEKEMEELKDRIKKELAM